MGDLAQIHALWQVLADEPVGVFIRSAWPRAVRVAEEDVHVQVGAELFLHRHFRALVVRHGLAQALGNAFEPPPEAVEDVFRGIAIELDQHDVAAEPLDQGSDRGLIHGPLDQIAFPVAGHDTSGDLRRSQRDGGHIGQARLALSPSGARKPRLVALTKQLDEFGSQRAARHGVDGAVNSLVGYRQSGRRARRKIRCRFHFSKSPRDLLGGPTAAQPIGHCAPKRRLEIGADLAASSACSGTPILALRLRGRCAIAVGKSRRRGLAANDLAADGGWTEAELVCDLTPTTSGLKQQLDRDAIGLAQMRVVSSHLRDTLQDARCRIQP